MTNDLSGLVDVNGRAIGHQRDQPLDRIPQRSRSLCRRRRATDVPYDLPAVIDSPGFTDQMNIRRRLHDLHAVHFVPDKGTLDVVKKRVAGICTGRVFRPSDHKLPGRADVTCGTPSIAERAEIVEAVSRRPEQRVPRSVPWWRSTDFAMITDSGGRPSPKRFNFPGTVGRVPDKDASVEEGPVIADDFARTVDASPHEGPPHKSGRFGYHGNVEGDRLDGPGKHREERSNQQEEWGELVHGFAPVAKGSWRQPDPTPCHERRGAKTESQASGNSDFALSVVERSGSGATLNRPLKSDEMDES